MTKQQVEDVLSFVRRYGEAQLECGKRLAR